MSLPAGRQAPLIDGRPANRLGPIAQLAEHSADNAGVRGAIPLWPTNDAGL